MANLLDFGFTDMYDVESKEKSQPKTVMEEKENILFLNRNDKTQIQYLMGSHCSVEHKDFPQCNILKKYPLTSERFFVGLF